MQRRPARAARPCRALALLAIAATACSWLPPDTPTARPVADPDAGDAGLFRAWKIVDHVLGSHALISDYDAAGFHGRTVVITASGYSSPWSGRCDGAARDKTTRPLAAILAEHDLARDPPAQLGLVEPIVEYRLSCGLGRTLPLTFYLGGSALTCWSGVCYVLSR
jgi:hypothetical protein